MPERLGSARQSADAQGERAGLADEGQRGLAGTYLQQATCLAVQARFARLLVIGLCRYVATRIERRHFLVHAVSERFISNRHGRHLRAMHGTGLHRHQQVRHPVDGKRHAEQQEEAQPQEGFHASESNAARLAVNNGPCMSNASV